MVVKAQTRLLQQYTMLRCLLLSKEEVRLLHIPGQDIILQDTMTTRAQERNIMTILLQVCAHGTRPLLLISLLIGRQKLQLLPLVKVAQVMVLVDKQALYLQHMMLLCLISLYLRRPPATVSWVTMMPLNRSAHSTIPQPEHLRKIGTKRMLMLPSMHISRKRR